MSEYAVEECGLGGIRARIVADSISNDIRLTTMELRYPRFIHSEFMTHRMFSRNASSSRAIPVSKMREQVEMGPAMPIHWGANQPGMQAKQQIADEAVPTARAIWTVAAANASHSAAAMSDYGVHKQVVNRLLEPFQFINVVVTATEWDNFFLLRNHLDAQPEIMELARCMQWAMDQSSPDKLEYGQWHLPYVDKYGQGVDGLDSLPLDVAIKCSVARCARVSYQTFERKTPTVEEDLTLCARLIDATPQHASPAEHQATPMRALDTTEFFWFDILNTSGVTHIDKEEEAWSANFRKWIQYRQML